MAEIYLAGGCFWGVEHYCKQIGGVLETETGYANSVIPNPTYEQVCADETDAVETVRVRYDEHRVPLSFLLELYFEIIDPLSVDKQGGDFGRQYRTGIYYTNTADAPAIEAALQQLHEKLGVPSVIECGPLHNFYAAEDYHQDYLDKNPGGYCHVPRTAFTRAKEASAIPYRG